MKIHFIGIKGVGMAALAKIALEKGNEVTGSDEAANFVTDAGLKKAGIDVKEFDVANLASKPDLVVVSAAYGRDNIEVKEAHKKHLEILTYSEMLARFSRDSEVIAVSGIHGKTTITALISFLLSKAGFDPSYVIGSGEIPSLGGNAHVGKGEIFVLEADEYRKSQEDPASKFFDFNPKHEIISSIELDHPDLFTSEEDVYRAFYKFACKVPRDGFIIICADYPKNRKLRRSLADRNFETYGFSNYAQWQIIDFYEDPQRSSFFLVHDNKKFGPFNLAIPGEGNCLNATAAIIMAIKLDISIEDIAKYLPAFSGVKRRFEKIAELNGITLIDDYAHHPRSVAMTLETVKKKFPSAKIWCIYQPHTYSRTKSLLAEFSTAFHAADRVIITEIYASAREDSATISGQDLADAIKKNHKSVRFISSWQNITREIVSQLHKPAVIITLGAGDIYKIHSDLQEQLKERPKDA